MNKRTRMMLMGGGKQHDKEYEKDHERWEKEYRNMPRDGYDMYVENRFRDRKGREHYDDGRYSPRSEYEGYMESRQRRDGRGRYMEYGHPMEAKYDDAMESHYYPSPYVPPIYKSNYMDDKPVSKIGFSMEGEINPDYRSDAEYRRMHEMDNMRGGEMMRGSYGGHTMQFNKVTAEQWAQGMKNADGTIGAHWNMEQAKQVMAQRGIEEEPMMFWLALNAEYSDRCKQYKKHNVNTIDMYVDGALDFWLHDKDAVSNKLAAYYECVVKH